MHNISGIMCKLSTHGHNSWSKTVAVIKKLYKELQEPLQITPLFLHAIPINTPNSVLTSTIALIHEDKGPSFMCKGESGKPKITKAATPMIILLIPNHCIHIYNNLLLDYSIQGTHQGPDMTCQFPLQAWFRCQEGPEQLEIYW
jgi:hypothetical protein